MSVFNPTKMLRFRSERGLTQKQLAEATQVHPVVVYRWESGRQRPGGPSIAKLARALGVEFEELLDEQRPAAEQATGRVQEVHATTATRGVRDASR